MTDKTPAGPGSSSHGSSGPNGAASNGASSTSTGAGLLAAVAGLASEVEEIRRSQDTYKALPGQVEQLAQLVTQLADATARTTKGDGGLVPTWLDLDRDVRAAEALLAELARWLGKVYLRYADGAQSLPDCWLWHPDLVEELLWLRHSWTDAYRVEGAPVSKAADWHDRLRPGVVKRVRAVAGTCSLDNHLHDRVAGPARVTPPVTEAIDGIAEWWASRRYEHAPEPTAQQLAAAATARNHTRRSRQ